MTSPPIAQNPSRTDPAPMAWRIDGIAEASALKATLGAPIAQFRAHKNRAPSLAVILVGDDPASQVYVGAKKKAAAALGIDARDHLFPQASPEATIIEALRRLSLDDTIDGILVQLPLPDPIRTEAVLAALDPAKDVDGLSELNQGRLLLARPGLRPCTPLGCVMLAQKAAQHLGQSLRGAHCVVLGRSILVGKPVAQLFLQADCSVTMAHSKTRNLPALCASADLLIAAIGQPRFVQGAWVKEGAIVIDVGINRIANPENGGTRLVGDVDFASASLRAGAVTPVPGGVGPITIACLLRNCVEAAMNRAGLAFA